MARVSATVVRQRGRCAGGADRRRLAMHARWKQPKGARAEATVQAGHSTELAMLLIFAKAGLLFLTTHIVLVTLALFLSG